MSAPASANTSSESPPTFNKDMTPEIAFLAQHSAHDFEAVLLRWEKIAAAANLRKTILADDEGGFPVIVFETSTTPDAESGLYLCAGVHGEEPAGVWGLIDWAEEHIEELRDSIGAVIFPCFNPSGLVANTRHDHAGRDLNRLFQDDSIPLMKAWRQFMADRKFRLALQLHEDYDARGIYMYELTREGEAFGNSVFQRIESIIPRDIRPEIEGNDFENGILLGTDIDIEERVEEELGGGYPEAIYVFISHAHFSLTFETPSEFSLWERVQSHRKFISEAISAAI